MGLDTILRMPRAAEPLSFEQLERLSDEQLMMALADSHGDALAVLFDRYQRLVYSVALKIVRDTGEAEDVTQNVFMEIFRTAAQFDPAKGSTKVWLLQYAYHRAINRRQQLQLRSHYDRAELDAVDEQVLPASRALNAVDSKRLVRQGLATVNDAERRVIQLACYRGLTMREIADKTGEPLANVRHHYYRGLEKLRSFVNKGPVPDTTQPAKGKR